MSYSFVCYRNMISNSLTVLPASAFAKLTSLSKLLDLFYSRVVHLLIHLLLIRLLSENLVTVIPSSAFQSLTNLVELFDRDRLESLTRRINTPLSFVVTCITIVSWRSRAMHFLDSPSSNRCAFWVAWSTAHINVFRVPFDVVTYKPTQFRLFPTLHCKDSRASKLCSVWMCMQLSAFFKFSIIEICTITRFHPSQAPHSIHLESWRACSSLSLQSFVSQQ